MLILSNKNYCRKLTLISHLLLIQACGSPRQEPTFNPNSTQAASNNNSTSQGTIGPQSADNQSRSEQNWGLGVRPRKAGPLLNLIISWDEIVEVRDFALPETTKVNGNSLKAIIESQVAGRDDSQLCSACHNNQEAKGGYGVAVDKNMALTDLSQWQQVGTNGKATWGGPQGWASKFIANPTKPESLKTVFKAWMRGGCK